MQLRLTLPLLIAIPGALILAACDPKQEAPESPAPASVPAVRADRPDGPMTLTAMQVRSDERFRAADTNGDGVISGEELQAMADGRGGGRGMARADADGDGRVTLEEARAQVAERFARMDANGDGAITEDERPQRGEVAGRRSGPPPQ